MLHAVRDDGDQPPARRLILDESELDEATDQEVRDVIVQCVGQMHRREPSSELWEMLYTYFDLQE